MAVVDITLREPTDQTALPRLLKHIATQRFSFNQALTLRRIGDIVLEWLPEARDSPQAS